MLSISLNLCKMKVVTSAVAVLCSTLLTLSSISPILSLDFFRSYLISFIYFVNSPRFLLVSDLNVEKSFPRSINCTEILLRMFFMNPIASLFALLCVFVFELYSEQVILYFWGSLGKCSYAANLHGVHSSRSQN